MYGRGLLVGQRRLPVRPPLAGPPRVPPHGRPRAALALSVGTILGRQWIVLLGLALRHRAVAEARPDVVGDLLGCVGHSGPLCDLSPAGRARWLLPLQPPSATRLLRCGLHPGTAADPD